MHDAKIVRHATSPVSTFTNITFLSNNGASVSAGLQLPRDPEQTKSPMSGAGGRHSAANSDTIGIENVRLVALSV